MLTSTEIFEVAKLFVAVIGFAIVLQTIESNAQGKLYDQYIKFQELLLDDPELRPYFYERRELAMNATAEEKGKLEGMCEVIAAVLEHSSLQKRNLRHDSWDNCWKSYTRERMEQSPHLRGFLIANKKLYTSEFLRIIEEIDLQLRKEQSD